MSQRPQFATFFVPAAIEDKLVPCKTCHEICAWGEFNPNTLEIRLWTACEESEEEEELQAPHEDITTKWGTSWEEIVADWNRIHE